MQSAIARSRRIITIGLAAGSLMLPLAVAASSNSSNNMIPNGCTTRATCTDAIASSDLQSFYADHGVTAATLHDAVAGTVTSSGRVKVDGKVVATGAQSYGRTFISGSVAVGPVFRRPTSVSFASSPLAALVYEPNGRFKFAIVESCGNLVTATPVAPIAPKPKPKAAVKVVAPQVTQVNNNVQVVQVQAQPTPPAPAPTPAPKAAVVTPQAAPAPAAAALPQTGAGTVGLVGLAALLTVSGYYFRSRRGLRWALLGNKLN